ncbi:gamma-glutamyl-gamma-aminobutyrate hydrolase family protein [Streptomyces arenae]|nr:gamma-glutamyl-gamma-aminobutyrate hydrolase family protein [Streptomyces arenae]
MGLTQRVLPADHNGERRQALDIRWEDFLSACGLLPVPLPLQTDLADATMREARCAGLVLTGGNDLAELGGTTPARDRLERHLLHRALAARQPVIGVCRGMQLILRAFGGHLVPVDGHVATEHPVEGRGGGRRVNSFHRWAALDVPGDLEATALSGEVVEAVRHRRLPLVGIMWHPERTEPADVRDVDLFTRIFHGGDGAA